MHLSSCRQEYKPWTGVRPAKSARRNPPAQYSSPGTEATHVLRETSYQAAYSGDGQRSIGLHQGEQLILSASTNIQPAAVPQPIPTALQAGSSPSPPGPQHSVMPERTELSGTIKGEVSADSHAVSQCDAFSRRRRVMHITESSCRFMEFTGGAAGLNCSS